jgi:nitrous oxide reductase accessory protein NosL
LIDSSLPILRVVTIVFMAASMLSAAPVQAGDSGPVPAQRPLTADGQIALSPADRCPVCAMFPARHARSAAAMTLNNGDTYYFCSNGCLLRTWLRPTVYLGRPRNAIDRLVVRDYFTGHGINARTAIWIAGSDVVGPMGPAIVALGDTAQRDAFIGRHGGKTVFTFDQVDDDLWRRISHRELPAKNSP